MMTRLALLAPFLVACSTTVTAIPEGPPGAAGAAGSASATGGAVSATGGAQATAGTDAGGSGGRSGAGGASAAGGAGGAQTGLHVDVVSGVQTDCVFPSTVTPPDFTACEPEDLGPPVGYCATPANPQLPITLSNLVWDYTTLTLTATLTINADFTVAFGSCTAPTSCDYKLDVVMGSNPATITIGMTRTDRGYVMSQYDNMRAVPVDSSCSDSYGQGEVNLCVQNGYSRSWAAWIAPCATP